MPLKKLAAKQSSERIENWLITSNEVDALNLFCALAIFISQLVGILWILWSIIPYIKEPKSLLNGNKLKQIDAGTSEEANKQPTIAHSIINTTISIEQRPSTTSAGSATTESPASNTK